MHQGKPDIIITNRNDIGGYCKHEIMILKG